MGGWMDGRENFAMVHLVTRGITDQRGPVRGASDLSQTGAPLRGAPIKAHTA